MAKNSRAAASAALTWARPAEPPPADRVPLTRDDIVSTAMRLIDERTDSRRSRCVAWARSSVPARPRSIGVRNKDELVDLMLDVIIGEVHADYEGAIAPDAPWREQLAEVARSAPPRTSPAPASRRCSATAPIGPNALDAAEHVMAILRGAGFDARGASLASGALISFASGFALFEARSPGGSGDAPETVELARSVMAYFKSLSPDRYPNMLEAAAVRISEVDQFEYGIARLLDGIEADRVRRQRAAG